MVFTFVRTHFQQSLQLCPHFDLFLTEMLSMTRYAVQNDGFRQGIFIDHAVDLLYVHTHPLSRFPPSLPVPSHPQQSHSYL